MRADLGEGLEAGGGHRSCEQPPDGLGGVREHPGLRHGEGLQGGRRECAVGWGDVRVVASGGYGESCTTALPDASRTIGGPAVGDRLTCSYDEDGYGEGANSVAVTTERHADVDCKPHAWGAPDTGGH